MNVLVLGASSYLGARLFFEMDKKFDVIGTYSSNSLSDKLLHLDITHHEDVMRVIDQTKPDVIIHTANNANPKWCETHPKEAILVNQTSMQSIIDAAKNVQAKIVYISSFSANDKTTVYGRTKHEAEQTVLHSTVPYSIIRCSLILGVSPNTTNDRTFNRLLKQIDIGTPVSYDTIWKFQPTYIQHVSEVIVSVLSNSLYGTIIPVAVSGVKSRYDIAKDILGPFGIDVLPIQTDDHGVVLTDPLSVLADLHLPEYTYTDIIQRIVEEIKNRQTYHL